MSDLKIRAAETPLKVFVSGRIRADLQPTRDAVEVSLRALSFVRAWLFERTPPSSEELDESYLRHVRDADFFILLVDAELSRPVQKEIAAALDAHVPSLVFVLPSASKTKELTVQLAAIKDRVRVCSLRFVEDLPQALRLALGDELIRALRGVGTGRQQLLLAQGLDSRGRTIARLTAAGVVRDRAIQLADTAPVGLSVEPYLPNASAPLRVIAAGVGAGKSLIGEVCLALAIRDAIDDPLAPVPLFERVGSLEGGLADWVVEASRGIGDPRAIGAFVVLDGADEPGARVSTRMLEEARTLVNSFPQTRVLITTRPLAAYIGAREVTAVPDLEESEAIELISQVAQREVTPGMWAGIDSSLRQTLQRPLFAVMYGALIAEGADRRILGRADIVAQLVERVIAGREDLECLEQAAAASTSEGRATLHKSEFGGFSDLQRVLNTGLLSADGDYVRFGLPILQEWFAAEFLLRRLTDIGSLLGTAQIRDRWRSAISLALERLDHPRANALLAWLVSADPAFASSLLKEFEPVSYWDTPPLQRPAVDYGREWQAATEGWAQALGPLGSVLLPIDALGKARPLGVRVDGSLLLFARDDRMSGPSLFELDPNALRQNHWTRSGHMKLRDRPGWAWAHLLDGARDRLRDLLAAAAVQVPQCEPYDREMSWLLASVLMDRGPLGPAPIGISALRERFASVASSDFLRRRGPLIPVGPLRRALEAATAIGGTQISTPWPAEDLGLGRGGLIWSSFSPGCLLERTRLIYEAAIEIYGVLVRSHFQPLAPRLWHWRVFPARLVGVLDAGEPTSLEGHPGLDYYFEPLEPGSKSEVAIVLDRARLKPDFDTLVRHYRERREDTVEWLRVVSTSTVLEVFEPAPATKLAFSWLNGDLGKINFGSGNGNGPGW